MCGIIAYRGQQNAVDKVLAGLKNLEYRGYDSWGIGALNDGLKITKRTGQIGSVSNTDVNLGEATTAIAHTRWATHGGVTETNSHPHTDCTGDIAVVHNGIIDNFQDLRAQLTHHQYVSDTDSEIIPHLIEQNLDKGFLNAVLETMRTLKGRSAFVALNVNTGELIAARNGTPLILGVGDNEYYIGSDVTAFLDYTKKVMYLDNKEVVVLDPDPHFYNFGGEKVEKRIVEITWDPGTSDKGDHQHYLIKEIMDQKHTIMAAANQDEVKLMSVANEIRNAYGTFLVGCGTAGKVCQAAEYLFSRIAHKHINYTVASEFSNYHHYLTPKTLMIAVSQSGETADVLEAIDVAKEKKVKVISLINVIGSTMMRESDDYFDVHAGVEKAVVSTKATTAQLSVLTLLAYAVAGKLHDGKILLMNAAAAVDDMLNPRYEEHIHTLAKKFKDAKNFYLIGRGMNYPIAMEGAIKLMEASYIHAQGFAAGELKHGPIALIEKGSPCLVLVANDENRADIISNAMEVKARGGVIIGVAPENNPVFDHWIKVPDAGNASPIVNIIPLQILAYQLAVLRGINPDRPRNLAKSVTVK